MKKNLTELVFILDRSGKSSSKLRVPFIPDANVGADDFSAQRRRSFCEMQRLIAVKGYGQVCMGSTLTVTVGAVEHPMVDVHHIQWLFVETENGGQLRYLTPGQAPKAVFELGSEKPVAVYAYCNLHGLWMTKL